MYELPKIRMVSKCPAPSNELRSPVRPVDHWCRDQPVAPPSERLCPCTVRW